MVNGNDSLTVTEKLLAKTDRWLNFWNPTSSSSWCMRTGQFLAMCHCLRVNDECRMSKFLSGTKNTWFIYCFKFVMHFFSFIPLSEWIVIIVGQANMSQLYAVWQSTFPSFCILTYYGGWSHAPMRWHSQRWSQEMSSTSGGCKRTSAGREASHEGANMVLHGEKYTKHCLNTGRLQPAWLQTTEHQYRLVTSQVIIWNPAVERYCRGNICPLASGRHKLDLVEHSL